ncbi:MAG: CocE/NonD family hydrolase [Thermodesulfobacteriota bacterium]
MSQAKTPFGIEKIENTWITLSDGCRLAAGLWLPENADKTPVPAILEYLPYRKRDTTAHRDEINHGYFSGHGYACVRVDMRGSGDSDGVLLGEYLVQEQDDALEVIDWIAAQPWCSGNVGMIGISWGGFNGLQVAARQPEALKTVISLCSTDDRYADDIHFMGGCLLTDKLTWGGSMLARYTKPPDPALVGERWREMWLERMEKSGLWVAEWHEHLRRDEFYKHGSIRENYADIKIPVYLVGGWADGYSNAIFRMLAHLKSPCKGLVGPWSHRYPNQGAPGPAIGFLRECLRWWDQWLKGIDTGVMEEPKLRVWMQEPVRPQPHYPVRPGRWVAEESWPSDRITARRFVPSPGRLEEGPSGQGSFTICSPQTTGVAAGKWTPHAVEPDLPTDQRQELGGSLAFDSQELTEDFEILGAPLVTLAVSADRTKALVAVTLSEVMPDGSATRITYGVLNLTHRESHEFPRPLEPNKPYAVTVKLNEIAHHFGQGNRLRLAISTAYWPLIWPSPEKVTLRLAGDGSALELPLRPPLPRDSRLPEFGPPEGASPPAVEMLAPPRTSWTITTDVASGRQTHERILDSGVTKLIDHDWEYGDYNRRTYSITPDDPLSARCEMVSRSHHARGEWRASLETRVAMSVTRDSFHLDAHVHGFEGVEPVFTRHWSKKLPRDLV